MKIDTQNAPVPSVKLDATTIPREHHFDAYREAVSPVLEISPSRDISDFEFSIEAYQVGEVVFSSSRYKSVNFERGRQHTQSRDDFIALQYFLSGSERVVGDFGQRLMASDSIVLRDWAHPFEGLGEPSFQFGVIIPRRFIKSHDLLFRKHPYLSWPLNSPVGGMISTTWMRTWKDLPRSTIPEADAITAGFVGLLNGVLAEQPSPSESTRIAEATLEAMKAYLLENLDNTNLTIDKICDRFCCSRAKLYRFFKEEGGIQKFLRDQRLARCFHEFSSPTNSPRNTRVTAVAEKYGFFDASYFSRAFKQTFGIAPLEVLNMESPEIGLPVGFEMTDAGKQIGKIKKWLTTI